MTKRQLIVLFLFLTFKQWNYSQVISQDADLRNIVSTFGQAEVIIPVTGKNEIDQISRFVSIRSAKDKTLHIVLSPLTLDWFIQQKYNYLIIENADSKGITSSEDLTQALEWTSYPTFTQYDSIMRSFITNYPSLCRLDTIGKSINGKLILALKISDSANVNENEPEVLYTSTIHGDETGGFVLMLHLADYLLKNYNLNSRVKNIVDNLELWINPLANPDGTYRSGNSIISPIRWNANGFDLNRNFPDPDFSTTPVQKENLEMIRFMRGHNFILSANFHAGKEVVNYPWDRWSRLHPDNKWFNNISRRYADTVHHYSEPGYMTYLEDGITNGYVWYKVNGGRQDYVTYELHGREVTIELDDNWITPSSQLNVLWNNNWHSFLGYLENALYGIHGIVNDSYTGDPVPARVFIAGHDKDSSHVYADTISGNFVRLLSSGSWDLLFTANGYHDTLITDVFVLDGLSTTVNVEMVPLILPVDSTKIPVSLILYPNPTDLQLEVLVPEYMRGEISVKIFSSSGIINSDFKAIGTPGIPLQIDVSNLAGGIYTMVITNRSSLKTSKERFIVVKR